MLQTVPGTRVYKVGASLCMVLELSRSTWLVGFGDGTGRRRRVKVAGGDLSALAEAIEQARQRFKLSEEAPVFAAYEAGREGFYLARWFHQQGHDCRVLESASLPVDRRHHQPKSDQLDLTALQDLVEDWRFNLTVRPRRLRWAAVPEEAVEQAREIGRARKRSLTDCRRHGQRIQALLWRHGIRLDRALLPRDFGDRIAHLRDWKDRPLAPPVRLALAQEWAAYQLADRSRRELEAEQRRYLHQGEHWIFAGMRQLIRWRGVGLQFAWTLMLEIFWRRFDNRKQVGAYVGLTPTDRDSGDQHQELGISRAGPGALRSMAVELAWLWLRYQPGSKDAQWYQKRWAHQGSRQRRIGIVALARRLVVRVFQFLRTGVLPEGRIQLKGI